MSIKSVWKKFFGAKAPELGELIQKATANTEAVYAANRRSTTYLQKLGQRGVAMLPEVIKAIEFAQQFLPNSGSGADRLELVKKVLQGIYRVANIQHLKFADDWGFWVPVIDNTVKELKDRSLLTSIPAK